jgi:adenylate kinase
MLNIALFGPPGAGKGTQSQKLIEKYNLMYIATGDILRKEISEGTKLGMEAKSVIESGGLVSDEIIVQIIEKLISTNTDVGGILFDGFPRTTVQAYILEGLLLKMNSTLNCMLSLEVPRDELVHRLLSRAKISGRIDDTEEVVEVRLQEYENKTLPVAEFYKDRNKFVAINGVGDIEDIYQRLTETVDDTLKKELLNVVLLGPPGAGKGTQGKLMAEKYNMTYISTGKLFRKEIKLGTEIGKKAAPYLEKGEIVPDEYAIQLIEREITTHPNTRGFIFKGFPRTIVQAYILDGLLRRINSSVSFCFELSVPTLESIKRLSARSKTETRRSYDMTTDMIVKRLEEYEHKTSLVAKFYRKQKKFKSIDGIGEEDEIKKRLDKAFEKAFKDVR